MSVAKELGLTLTEAMDKISDLELRMWAAYFQIQKEENERAMKNNGKHGRNNSKGRRSK
jgi:hypothetical protein